MRYINCDLCGKVVIKPKKLMIMDEGNFFRALQITEYDICSDCTKEIYKKINNVKKFGPKE